jgi:hypothetical protein
MDDELHSQLSFELQIDDDSDFSSPEVDRLFTGLNNPPETVNTQGVDVRYTPGVNYCDENGKSIANPALNTCGFINYNANYYWRVKVQDDLGIWSKWFYYNNDQGESGTTDVSPGIQYEYPLSHPDPWPDFGYAPSNPEPGEVITFLSDSASDPSICFRLREDDNIEPYFCDQQTYGWLWEFGDGQSSSAIGYTTHSYANPNTYSVILKITDDKDVTCQIIKAVPVTTDGSGIVPNWREVSPFR